MELYLSRLKRMPVQKLYMIDGNAHWYEFDDLVRSMEWTSEITNLKIQLCVINHFRSEVNAPQDMQDYGPWLQLAQDFISKWGRIYVPKDIRQLINYVEAKVGVPRTHWNLHLHAILRETGDT